jgi:hypothetical protein
VPFYRKGLIEKGLVMDTKVLASHSITMKGVAYVGVVTDDSFAGHGKTGRFRYTIYSETEYRPRVVYGVRKDLNSAEREIKGWMTAALIMGGTPCKCCREV